MAYVWDKDRQEYVEVIKIANIDELGIGGGGGEAGSVDWANVTNKPQTYPPSEHNHDDRYNTKEEVQGIVDFVTEQMEQEQGKVRTFSDDSPDFLKNKVDAATVGVRGSEVYVRSVDGLNIGVTDINNALEGVEGNVQTQINDLMSMLEGISGGMKFKGIAETRAEIDEWDNKENGDVVVVLTDETRNDGRSMYVYSEDLGMWRYIGTFTFTTNFTGLSDTPNAYENGKYLKSTNSGIVYGDVDYQDIANKPQSTITQIDDAVAKRHEHGNKDSLDGIGENTNGTLTYKGEEYVKKSDIITPQKKTLSAYTNKEEKIYKSDFLKFHKTLSGSDIPYDTTTGIFELEIGKKYEITVNLQTEVGGFLVFRVSKADKSDFLFPTAVMYGARSSAVYGGSGTLNLIIQPTIETGTSFAIQTSPDSSDDYTTVRRSRCSLVIKEL